MTPAWHSNHRSLTAAQQRKQIIHEAYRKRLIVKRRPDTPLEQAFMQIHYEQMRAHWLAESHMRQETIESMDVSQSEIMVEEPIEDPQDTYSVKPQRGRQIITTINGELWASARWLFNNLEYSIGFDSLTSWLSKYRGCVRRKISPDGHIWLHHVEDFKNWRKKSVGLQVRQESVKAQIQEARL